MEQHDPLETLFARARKHRIPMAAICERAKIDPTTPSRWKRGKNGATVDKLSKLQGALSEIIEELAA
jgi:transcriptional regulator with XRE-family HTH domain